MDAAGVEKTKSSHHPSDVHSSLSFLSAPCLVRLRPKHLSRTDQWGPAGQPIETTIDTDVAHKVGIIFMAYLMIDMVRAV